MNKLLVTVAIATVCCLVRADDPPVDPSDDSSDDTPNDDCKPIDKDSEDWIVKLRDAKGGDNTYVTSSGKKTRVVFKLKGHFKVTNLKVLFNHVKQGKAVFVNKDEGRRIKQKEKNSDGEPAKEVTFKIPVNEDSSNPYTWNKLVIIGRCKDQNPECGFTILNMDACIVQ